MSVSAGRTRPSGGGGGVTPRDGAWPWGRLVLVLVLAGPQLMAPPSQRCARPKAWSAKEAPGLPHTWRLHMGAAHVVVGPRIWYAPGIDPVISRVLSACPTAGPTATVLGGGGVQGGGGGGVLQWLSAVPM